MIIKDLKEFYASLRPNAAIIGIDYGQKKCGIAISNPEITMAIPLKQIIGLNDRDKVESILDTIKQHNISGIVIGLPLNMDGSRGLQTETVIQFANNITSKYDLPLYLQDERLTSKTANNMLKSIGIKRKNRNVKDDPVAAALILETVIEAKKYIRPPSII